MRLRNMPGSREMIEESPFCVQKPEFKNDNPIHIEIGMGKGRFLMALAKQNPRVNYVGIERHSSVLVRILPRLREEPLDNIHLIRMDAEDVAEVFGSKTVERIYLNFSDPWPKDRHAKRRLTSKEFLERYDHILKKDGRIELKTDNRDLFNFSLEQLDLAGWRVNGITRNLHEDEAMSQGNVMTEYESRFSAMGNPIYKLIASR